MYEHEYEFKSLISEVAYNNLLAIYGAEGIFEQQNFYFDHDNILQDNNMALRLRKKANCNRLTIKHRNQDDSCIHSIEVSDYLDANEVTLLFSDKVIRSAIILDYFNEHGIAFRTFNSVVAFTTVRVVHEFRDHSIFIDKTIFANNMVDYEFELEAETPQLASHYFKVYANKYNLIRNMHTKISRAHKYSKN